MDNEPAANPEPLSDQQMLLMYLAERDVPCPSCGYNLRELSSTECPECGKLLTLSVGVVGGLSGAWITSLVAAVVAAGVGLPFQTLFLIGLLEDAGRFLSEISRHPELLIGVLILTYSFCCWGFSVGLLRGRRRFQSWPIGSQKGVAAALITCNCICLLMVLAMISGAFY